MNVSKQFKVTEGSEPIFYNQCSEDHRNPQGTAKEPDNIYTSMYLIP